MKHILLYEAPDDETTAKPGLEEEETNIEPLDTTENSTKSKSAPVSPKKAPAKRYKILKLEDDTEKKPPYSTKQLTLFELMQKNAPLAQQKDNLE
jgi:hypothetical protein